VDRGPAGGPWIYPPEFMTALAALGVAPTPRTPPSLARGAVDELYKYELRRLRDRLRTHQVERRDYTSRVIDLRRKYWVLTLPLAAWEKICAPPIQDF
jgi:hypothetical protein